jgi:hypothetical protein
MSEIGARIGYAILLGLCVFFTCGDACWPVPQPGSADERRFPRLHGCPIDRLCRQRDRYGHLRGAVCHRRLA